MKKNILSAEALTKIKTKEVEIAGGIVVIKQMSAGYALALRGKEMQDDDTFKMVADMVVEPKLTAEQVGQMNIADVTDLANAILEFNGITQDAIEKAKADLKNDPTEGSTKI
jgi:hypothetical protein